MHWIYKIKRKLHGGLKVWILSSCGIYIYSKINQQTDEIYIGYFTVAQRYDFTFEWWKQATYGTFISSGHSEIFFLLHRFNAKVVNDVIDVFTSEDMGNISIVIF